ncbi:metallophosphoesterase family protein [Mangrovicoccus algicola]|uniref:Metallophosphoesterase n=1 Tax=Mangrovicoccus algicola TaxID=2771008 RepID=A0A8J6Z594_9RHOB|nr:metallophosphoesterase family protein [Mangrovicoccus algicola]MBE3636836.1 metallophosphoesterase [Mangrovicoccus algicola]
MRRIVHISDLHYGRVDAALEQPLADAVRGLEPDLLVVSGDLTQRARHGQFRAARAFLDELPGPQLCVPGNHDTPLDNLWVRFLRPFGRYRHHICADLEPVHADEEMVVAGVNTVNRFSWQRGRIGRGRLARLSARMEEAGDRLRVAVLHHPLEHGPETPKRLMRGARETLEQLSGCGADLVLSGHLHMASAEPFRAVPGLLFVQAGTVLSTRLRHDEPNTFNQIDHEAGRLRIVTWAAGPRGFAPVAESIWQRGNGGWHREAAAAE